MLKAIISKEDSLCFAYIAEQPARGRDKMRRLRQRGHSASGRACAPAAPAPEPPVPETQDTADGTASPAAEEPAEAPAPDAPPADTEDHVEELSSGEQLPEPPTVHSSTLAAQADAPVPYEDNYIYEEYEDELPRRKRSLKWLWIALPIAAAVIATVTGIAVWFNAPMQKLTRALDANDYTTVTQLLPQLSEEELRGVAEDMKTYAAAVIDRYNSGETDYTSAYELLDRLRRLFPDSGLDNDVKRIEALKASKDAFNEAQYLEESGEAAGAVSRYSAVIADDTNYEAAQKQIEAVRAAYKEQVLEEAQALADSRITAARRPCFEQQRRTRRRCGHHRKARGAEKGRAGRLRGQPAQDRAGLCLRRRLRRRNPASGGCHEGRRALHKADRGLQEPVQGSCAQGGRGLCGKLRLRGRGGGARKIAGASFSDDADIAAKNRGIRGDVSGLLADLSPSGGMDCATGWTASDASGNSYGSGLSFALYPVIQKTVETEYEPGGQYRRLSGIMGDRGATARTTSPPPCASMWTAPRNMRSRAFTRGDSPAEMNLIIDGAETVRIEVEGSFSSLRSTGYVYLADATFGN